MHGAATTDNCGTCDAVPSNNCEKDCEDVWGGLLVIDICGICGGDDDCEGIDCTDNLSGYCQDLSVLQILIDNSSGTLNMNMDEN